MSVRVGRHLTACLVVCVFETAPSAWAQSPSNPPPPAVATTQDAMPFMRLAGESDIYEITASMLAVQRAQNPEVRRYASMLIDHHTKTTNAVLAQAASSGLAPPPAVLGPNTRDARRALCRRTRCFRSHLCANRCLRTNVRSRYLRPTLRAVMFQYCGERRCADRASTS